MSAISTERKWDIAVVKLDVPGKSLNILTPEVMDEIKSTFIDLNKDESVEGIVFISGKLSSFIAGVDISTVESITDPSVGTRKAAEGQAVFNLIEDMPVPVVCAINGICHGGGTELALACNYRIASDNIGAAEIRRSLKSLADKYGTRLSPAEPLKEGRSFYV